MNLKQFRRQKLPRGYFKKRKHEPETERPPDIAKIKLNHIVDEHANTIRMIKTLVSMLCMGAIVIQGSAAEFETTIEPDLKVLSLETTIAPYVNHNGTGNCLSLHVRGDITDLDYLRGCQVIEGNLIISILEDETEESYLNYTFPSLVEITGYLMLYRVSGIKTFYTMFPNLSVIRGTMLFKDYSLIVYECEELETLGFYKLLTIERGHIRIEKNSQLCFADRIDWSLISGAGEHFIDKNKRTRHCNPCSTTCPRTDQANKIFLCWDDKHCQTKCKSDCKTKICSPNGTCCDESCVGGCDDDNLSKCKACKKVKVVEGDSFTCAEKCPPGKFEYLNRRCLTRHECFERNSIVKKDITNISQFSSPFIPHNGFCERGCPPNHFEDRTVKNETICTRCGVECLKRCAAPVIDSIAAAQSLKSCAYIDGALEIQIRSRSFDQAASIVKELEKSLSDIEVIEDYLKVARSFPLRSLSFLKRLRRIKGTRLESNKFALVIWDNQNLQELWIDDQKLQIDRGKFFFHLNPRLCFNLIENLANSSTQIENYENAKLNNGDKTPCNITVLDVTVVSIYPQAVLLTWPPLKLDDERSLLSYVIYYTPTLQKNVTLWEGRDACGNDGWMVDDIKDYTMNNEISYPMTRLEPHTMYAYYVTAFTLSTEKTGAQSAIDYFKTLPGKPQTVRKFTVTPRSSSALDLKWDPPLKVHGELSHYIIRARIKVNADSLDPARDYCEKPIDESQAKPQNKYEEQQKSSIFAECDCDTCYNTCEKPRKEGDDQRQLAIDFENEIQDFTWTKVTQNDEPVVRAKRQAPSKKEGGSSPLEFPFEMSTEQNKKKEADARSIKESKWEEGGYYSEIYKEISVNEPTTFEMTELRHYTQYQIWVVACRALYDRSDPLYKKADHYDPEDNPCGPSATINELTLKKEGSDDIHIFNAEAVTNGSSGLINVTWKPPTDPNGHIASYTVRYKKSDIENTKWESICVHYNKTFHILNHLSNGNYSIEVAAISLGGHGNFTAMKYVLINETTGNTLMWAVLWSFLFILVMITIALVYFIKRHYLKNISNMKLIANVNPDYAGVHYKQDDWEVARDKIIQLQELGQGSFGMVYEGIVKDLKIDGSETRCAIKTVNENATDKERISFLNEASVMKKFDTAFVVRLLGVVSQSQPTMVIMELMQCGDLKGFLRSHRSDYDRGDNEPIPNPPTVRQIVQMSAEIADGMSYLSAMKFVHRDLAARNCMVSEALTVKIGDFGMTRDIYETDYYRKGTKGLLPVRWMSPESLKDGVFTSSSDVFSFGVVLWEMATLASQPYQGLSNDQVLRYVIEGGVMERPENCPDKLYELMRRCWHHRPSARPTFIEIIEMFIDEVNQNFRNVAFYFSKDGQDALHQNRQSGYSVNITDDVTTPLRQDEEDTSSTDNNRFLMEDLNSGRKFHEL